MKGIIFDMDGTMVDNMLVHHRAWQNKLASLGLELSLEEVQEQIHGINEEILERLFGSRFTPEERKRIAYEKEAEYRRIFLPELQLVAGLPALLEGLVNAGIPIAIGTAAPQENVDFVLEHLHLRPYFKAVLHAGSVDKGKPDPEIFEKAAAAIETPIENCLVFEDSPTGAEAARRAGCTTIILTTTHQAEEFRQFPNVVKCIDDFSGVSLEEVLKFKTRPWPTGGIEARNG